MCFPVQDTSLYCFFVQPVSALFVFPVIDRSMAPPTPGCPPSWFPCGPPGECVEDNKVCDFTPHCPDGQDEANCCESVQTQVVLRKTDPCNLFHDCFISVSFPVLQCSVSL